jgi:very-short-patch-repair endonuclease
MVERGALRASSVLEAHQSERSGSNARIVSIVVGPSIDARRTFAQWARQGGLWHAVPSVRDADLIVRSLRAFPDGSAVLFAPETGDLAEALRAAFRLAEIQPGRPLGVIATADEMEQLLRLDENALSPLRRMAIIGGLVLAEDPPPRELARQLASAEQLYRSAHEATLHKLMKHNPDIGDIFQVNFRYQPAPLTRSFEIDFWCETLRLALEIDGSQHSAPSQRAADNRRDAALHRHGVLTLRIHASTLMSDPTAALRQIAASISARRRELIQS